MHDWLPGTEANVRMLINQGIAMAQNNPSIQKLRPIVIELYKLLPPADEPIGAKCPKCGMAITKCKCVLEG